MSGHTNDLAGEIWETIYALILMLNTDQHYLLIFKELFTANGTQRPDDERWDDFFRKFSGPNDNDSEAVFRRYLTSLKALEQQLRQADASMPLLHPPNAKEMRVTTDILERFGRLRELNPNHPLLEFEDLINDEETDSDLEALSDRFFETFCPFEADDEAWETYLVFLSAINNAINEELGKWPGQDNTDNN